MLKNVTNLTFEINLDEELNFQRRQCDYKHRSISKNMFHKSSMKLKSFIKVSAALKEYLCKVALLAYKLLWNKSKKTNLGVLHLFMMKELKLNAIEICE
jgi:hypothetical protein